MQITLLESEPVTMRVFDMINHDEILNMQLSPYKSLFMHVFPYYFKFDKAYKIKVKSLILPRDKRDKLCNILPVDQEMLKNFMDKDMLKVMNII